MLQLVGVEEIVTVAATDRQAEAYRTHSQARHLELDSKHETYILTASSRSVTLSQTILTSYEVFSYLNVTPGYLGHWLRDLFSDAKPARE